jgi:hypothetical protein
MNRLKSACVVACIAVTMSAQGQEFKKVATAGYTFLEVPVTAQAAALGEAFVAISDARSDAVFTNPAALGLAMQDHLASFSYAPWFADIKQYGASYAYNSTLGVIGLGVVVFDYGTMLRTERVFGQQVYSVTGEFKSSAYAVGLTFSRRLTDQFSFGATVKYAGESIAEFRSSNLLFDGGVLYYTGVGTWRIAGSLQNFGTEQKYIVDPFKMPAILRLGTAAELVGDFESEWRVTALLDATHPTDQNEHVNLGMEIAWNRLVVLRGGYKFFYDEETYSLGMGLIPQTSIPAGVDFAFSDYGRLGKIVRFTLHVEL